MLGAIAANELDVAFLRPASSPSLGILFTPLMEEHMFAAINMAHPLALRRNLKLEDLSDEQFVIYRERGITGIGDRIVQACVDAGFSPKIAQDTPQASAALALVGIGIGISVVPECMRKFRPYAIRYIPIKGWKVQERVALAKRANNSSIAVHKFTALAVEISGRK
jgi:DNA-binding transcriptional LysR family regulator